RLATVRQAILSSGSKGEARKHQRRSLAALRVTAQRLNFNSHGDLAEYAAQFVKIHRLGKMEIETSLSAAFDIVTRGKARERYGFDRSFSFRLGNDLVTISVRQRNITQHNIELFRVDHLQGALRAISGGNLMTEMIQKARQRFQSVAVILDYQN